MNALKFLILLVLFKFNFSIAAEPLPFNNIVLHKNPLQVSHVKFKDFNLKDIQINKKPRMSKLCYIGYKNLTRLPKRSAVIAFSQIDVYEIANKIIKKYGAVSVQCCLSMVNNLSKISNSHINISITGIAGPKGGTREKPVGLVFIGLKFRGKTLINKYLFKNRSRKNFQKIFNSKVH